jgi:hypothetical protein
VAASNFGEREQLGLFDAEDPRRRRVVEASDEVRKRFGERAITRARLLGRGLPAPFERDPRSAIDGRRIGVPPAAGAGDGRGRKARVGGPSGHGVEELPPEEGQDDESAERDALPPED